AVFLGFGFVSARSQGSLNLLLRQSLAKTQKSSLQIGYSIFSNALLSVAALRRGICPFSIRHSGFGIASSCHLSPVTCHDQFVSSCSVLNSRSFAEFA
ncbi:MAG TPA: hypothetical protein VFV81_00350, partial [Verrucomicrobiae bacterium]|nr:hypothetical protein [Verrucomicrobiae bacterium]